MWWAVVTLTTTGYGDVVPLTVGGRMIGSVLMISGIAVLALMTGVLATGFAQEERRREYLRVWEQVTRVPIFAVAGRRHPVGDRGQAAHPLLPRARHRAAARRSRRLDVLHLQRRGRGAPAHRRHGPAGRRCLLRRDVAARIASRARHDRHDRPTTLLVLYASDFYEIASHIPALAEAVENEAKRRREENLERQSGGSKP